MKSEVADFKTSDRLTIILSLFLGVAHVRTSYIARCNAAASIDVDSSFYYKILQPAHV